MPRGKTRPESPPPLAEAVVAWQRTHGRHHLPWQGTREPYRVWLSEVMLQQTQVATVLGYYERFLARFADVAALAAAPLDDVLALWSGLGYYGRARNLHACARAVVNEHGGAFPRTAEGLATLPGIGRSTAAAIASICFGERVAILDGNVKRVLTRVLGFDGDLAETAALDRLWQHAEALVPEHAVAVYTQGLMDLGATLCTARAPRCDACPLAGRCVARARGEPERFPVKTRRLKRGRRSSVLLWLEHRGRWWLQQRPGSGVWGGLWCLPVLGDEPAYVVLTEGWPGEAEALPAFVHVLTHFDWTLAPVRLRLPDKLSATRLRAIEQALGEGRWLDPGDALSLGLPAPVRKLFESARSAG